MLLRGCTKDVSDDITSYFTIPNCVSIPQPEFKMCFLRHVITPVNDNNNNNTPVELIFIGGQKEKITKECNDGLFVYNTRISLKSEQKIAH